MSLNGHRCTKLLATVHGFGITALELWVLAHFWARVMAAEIQSFLSVGSLSILLKTADDRVRKIAETAAGQEALRVAVEEACDSGRLETFFGLLRELSAATEAEDDMGTPRALPEAGGAVLMPSLGPP